MSVEEGKLPHPMIGGRHCIPSDDVKCAAWWHSDNTK